jgi:hypothetical protein
MILPNDRALFWVNVGGAIALALFLAMSLFFWSHPGYMPACAPSGRGRCGGHAVIHPMPRN